MTDRDFSQPVAKYGRNGQRGIRGHQTVNLALFQHYAPQHETDQPARADFQRGPGTNWTRAPIDEAIRRINSGTEGNRYDAGKL